MGKVFNVTGACNPKYHYMVNIEQRLQDIKQLVDAGNYFAINRARQYGKTTTLSALAEYLREEYIVVYLDFQMLGNEDLCRRRCAENWRHLRFLTSIVGDYLLFSYS